MLSSYPDQPQTAKRSRLGRSKLNEVSGTYCLRPKLMISKIFKAYDVRAIHPDPLSVDAVQRVGFATGQFLKEIASHDNELNIAVSRDMRPSSPNLAEALIGGLLAAGASVTDLGMCDTSFIYFAVNHLDLDGGIQVTASHNPIEYNGLKICGPQARPIGRDSGLLKIQKIAEHLPRYLGPPSGSVRLVDLWEAYRKHIHQFLEPLNKPIRVFIDGSNGMAGELIPRIFYNVKNLEIIPLNFEITGSFVHEPNPLVPKNMAPTQEGVHRDQADLGACFDGDADRCMLTDELGQIIGCDHLTALLAEHFMAKAPGAAVVYDLRSSKVVKEQICRLGGDPHRSRVGHVFLKALMRQINGIFGGELSGHFYFRDNFYADSGAIAFASVLSILAQRNQPISELIDPLKKYPQSGELNFHVQHKDQVLTAVKAQFDGRAQIDELDGTTIDLWDSDGFWFNVRPSNTEPLLRLNAEARDEQTLHRLIEQITPHLGEPDRGH